jgi:hypothetical protein
MRNSSAHTNTMPHPLPAQLCLLTVQSRNALRACECLQSDESDSIGITLTVQPDGCIRIPCLHTRVGLRFGDADDGDNRDDAADDAAAGEDV